MSQITAKKVLVTGGAGFIGSNLCDNLIEQGNEVVCLDNFSTGSRSNIKHLIPHPKFTVIEDDIQNFHACLEATSGVDLVLHQAALGSVPRSIEHPITTNNVNITGFLHMLEASRKNGIKRFVYAASSSTYGDSKELPKVEDIIGLPLSPYAVTKYCNELYAHVYHNLHGLEIIGLRYFNVFGKRQRPDGAYAAAIPRFIHSLKNGESPTVHGDGEQSRDFTHVENVILANNLAATTNEEKAFGQVFNVACGEQITINKLIETIQHGLIQKGIINTVISSNHIAERKGDVKHSLADISKIKNILSYRPTVNFTEGIEKTIERFF